MYNTMKGLIKKTPPMKWLLGRLNKLEKAQKDEIKKREKCIKQLKKQIRDQENNIIHDMIYLYNKGLQPNQYAAALVDWYYKIRGQRLDLDNPKTYNEKIQWLKLYDSTPLKTRLADKYLVREWVIEKIGKEYLIPLLGVYDKFDDIDFNDLPNQFVLKTNHGSGWNIIVKDKGRLDILGAKKQFRLWMGQNYAYKFGLELHYLNIPPKIIVEEYLEELDQVYDYKFMCFDGKVKFIWVDTDRFTNHRRTLFTTNWTRMNATIAYNSAEFEIPKPQNFEKMLELATKLCQGFAHVRVDFYNVNGKIYFGEMTFTSGSGIEVVTPEEFGNQMGEWIRLPEKSEIPVLKMENK